jgi:hypothetical protein
MDPNATPTPMQLPTQHPGVCPVCHQPVAETYYFCPNCGAKIHEPPLSTSLFTQAWIYAFSLILPVMCYLFITRWPGIRYLRSKDEDARTVGTIACGLLALSTFATMYYAYVWTEDAIQSQVNQINQDMSI